MDRPNISAKDGQHAPEPPPLCDYAAEVITRRLEKMLSHVEGVRQNEEIEPVHQMRVWSRRSRAALDIFACCFPGKEFVEIERIVRSVTGALGEARDLDVMIETLEKRLEDLPPPQRPGLESFLAHLRRRRVTAQKAVEKALDQLERHDLVHRFEALAGTPTLRDDVPARPADG